MKKSNNTEIKTILGLCVNTLEKKGYGIIYASLETDIVNEDIYFIMIRHDTPLEQDAIKDIPPSWGDMVNSSFAILYMDNITSCTYEEIYESVSNLYAWAQRIKPVATMNGVQLGTGYPPMYGTPEFDDMQDPVIHPVIENDYGEPEVLLNVKLNPKTGNIEIVN